MQKTKHLFILITLLFICFSAAAEAEINIQTNDKNISKGNPEGKAVPLIPSEQGEHATGEEDKSINNKNRSDYLIKGKDILHITVYDEPDLSYDSNTNRSLRVSVDGKISFPLLGDVKAGDLTPCQLEKRLEQLLSDGYLINPHVSVIIGNYHGSICVIGQIRKPGPINLIDRDITVTEAISMAGGFTDIASPKRTRIIRLDDGVEKTIYVNVKKIIQGKTSKDFILKPGDIVVVPEAFF